MLRSFSFSENSPAPASPCLRDFPSPCESGLEKLALEGPESDLEKFDESDSEDAHALEKGTLEEGALEVEDEERRKTE